MQSSLIVRNVSFFFSERNLVEAQSVQQVELSSIEVLWGNGVISVSNAANVTGRDWTVSNLCISSPFLLVRSDVAVDVNLVRMKFKRVGPEPGSTTSVFAFKPNSQVFIDQLYFAELESGYHGNAATIILSEGPTTLQNVSFLQIAADRILQSDSSLQIRGVYFDNLSLGICIFEVKGSFSGSVLALRDINASVGFDFGSSQLPVARFDIEDTTVQQSKITVLYRVQSSQDLIIRLNGMLIDQLYPSSASDGNLGGAVKTFGSVVNAVISNVVMKNSQGPCF